MSKNFEEFKVLIDSKMKENDSFVYFKNKPDTSTPLSAENLNKNTEAMKKLMIDLLEQYHDWSTSNK